MDKKSEKTIEEQELRDFRDLQDASHFAQSDEAARTIRRCQIFLIINTVLLIAVGVLLVLK